MTKEKEMCVLCGRETQYSKDDNISVRRNYVEGCGQLCDDCCGKVKKKNKMARDLLWNFKQL